MNLNFTGKTALVTGASKGIGFEIMMALADKGATVYGLARNVDSIIEAKSKHSDRNIEAIACDITDSEKTQTIINNIGDIDFLVNNAGTNKEQSFFDIDKETLDSLIDVNLKSVFVTTQAVAQNLKKRNKSGSVVNISSQASKRYFKNHAVYSSCKAGLDALTKSMANELGVYNIRVNCVSPTVVFTDLGRYSWSDPAKADPVLARIPLNRFAEIQDIVPAVLFLLSDAAGMITGAMLPIEGGYFCT